MIPSKYSSDADEQLLYTKTMVSLREAVREHDFDDFYELQEWADASGDDTMADLCSDRCYELEAYVKSRSFAKGVGLAKNFLIAASCIAIPCILLLKGRRR